jgi:hypothetical protein
VTDVEERLRRDLRQAAGRIDPESVRPLRAPRRRTVPGAVRWLAPVTAVVAVVGVIVGVSLATARGERSSGLKSVTQSAGLPPYYVTTGANPQQGKIAIVNDSVTGAVLSIVRLPNPQPPGLLFVTGAADERTFLIADGADLLRLQVAPDGRSAQFRRLPIAAPTQLGDMVALSPDGDLVAIESQSACANTPQNATQAVCQQDEIQVISLTTGARRTWSTRAPILSDCFNISWAGNDQILFAWSSATSAVASGDWLLNVAGSGGSLLSARHLPVPPPPVFDGISYNGNAFLTPDRSAVITSTFVQVGQKITFEVAEFSVSTGRVLSVPYADRTNDGDLFGLSQTCDVVSAAAAGPGVHALIVCPGSVFGRVDDGRFTPLPAGGLQSVDWDAAW